MPINETLDERMTMSERNRKKSSGKANILNKTEEDNNDMNNISHAQKLGQNLTKITAAF